MVRKYVLRFNSYDVSGNERGLKMTTRRIERHVIGRADISRRPSVIPIDRVLRRHRLQTLAYGN
jgi:hypothetical protein